MLRSMTGYLCLLGSTRNLLKNNHGQRHILSFISWQEEQGRKALDYFKIRYGINASHLITDDQIYNGTDVPLGNYTFSTTSPYQEESPYRLIIESKENKAKYYKNPPEIGEIVYAIEIHNELNEGGTFNKTLFPGDFLAYGEYLIKTPKRCSMDGLTVIHFVTDPVKVHGGSGTLTHPEYGKGSLQVSFVTNDDGLTDVANVLRFPANQNLTTATPTEQNML
ncbi:unnamed protein product [Owenia fusiformis]|uniref:Uncharacterized protein n=1 Tax=Owenia fusiformis TaxID=6347 RepID=A0A8J1T4W4_OWEFU|nr:unnamed protein product [Owenia fusiformis]